MQVFTPIQAKSVAEQRAAKDAFRAKGLADITEELLQEKKEAELEFNATMERQKLQAQVFIDETSERKNLLAKEVERLEKRRQEALKPPLVKAEDIHSISEALHARKLELDAQEIKNEDASRSLMHKLDIVSTTEQDLSQREKRLKVKELGAETQRMQVAKDAKRITLQLQSFVKMTEEKETEIAFKQSELDARTNLIKQTEDGFVTREKEIQAAMRLLADQRLLLEKGFKELRLIQL